MEYLIYLIPGIIAFNLYKFIVKNIPKDKYELDVIVTYITLSIESYFIILINIIIFEKDVTIQTNLGILISTSIITSLSIIKALIYTLIGIIIPVLIRWIISRIKLKKNIYSGSIAYTETFLKTVFDYYDKDNNAIDVMSFNNSELNQKINSGEIKRYSKPVKIIKNGNIIKGQITNFYGTPWDFREFFIDNSLVDERDYVTIENTYFDLENDIIIEIYRFSENE